MRVLKIDCENIYCICMHNNLWNMNNEKWNLLYYKQLSQKQKMQRPPRPGIKSSQQFPYSQLRKIMTPDCFLQSIQSCLAQQTINSMRDVAITNGLHNSIGQTQNVEYLEISRQMQNCTEKNNKYTINSRSFKIRNFSNTRARTIKENTVPLKGYNKSASNNYIPAQSAQNIHIQYSSTMKLKNYPHQFQLNTLGDTVAYRKISPLRSTIEQFDQWAIIISQSIFYGSLIQQTNILKLKNLVQNIRRLYAGINIIFHIHNMRQVDLVTDMWQSRKINIQYAIWSKHKYFQSLNAFDLTQISKLNKMNRFIICEDSHESTKNLYYQCQPKRYYEVQEQFDHIEPHFQIDRKAKYIYLKFYGLPNLMKFSVRSKICKIDDLILTDKIGFSDQTQYIFDHNSIKQKIKAIQIKKILKLKRKTQRKSFSSKDIRTSVQGKNKKQANVIDKNQQFKRKILQYAKILQEEIKNRQIKTKSLEKTKQNKHENNYTHMMKLLGKQFQISMQAKFSHQMINELLKNNCGISKQITKFSEKVEGLNFQQIYNNNF